MSSRQIHPDFRLNGISFAENTLKDVAYSYIKVGEPFEKSIGVFLFDWLDDSLTITVQTSGSTGVPKQIHLQKRHMVNSARSTGEYFDLQASSSALLCLSTDYIAGKMMLVRAMVLGLHLDCIAPDSKPLNNNEKEYSFCAMVPLQVENSLEKLVRIKKLIIGGAPVSFSLRQKIELVDCSVFETYGMTETITHVAVRNVNLYQVDAENHSETKRAMGNFEALPRVLFSTDERECLVISAPNISDHPVVTNDMVNLISETEFEWLGRFDNVINSGGIKLHPESIEEKLNSVITERFFVVGLPDNRLGQKLVLLIESENYSEEAMESMVFIPLLEKYEIPKEVLFLPKFILTQNGKLNRRATTRLIEAT